MGSPATDCTVLSCYRLLNFQPRERGSLAGYLIFHKYMSWLASLAMCSQNFLSQNGISVQLYLISKVGLFFNGFKPIFHNATFFRHRTHYSKSGLWLSLFSHTLWKITFKDFISFPPNKHHQQEYLLKCVIFKAWSHC